LNYDSFPREEKRTALDKRDLPLQKQLKAVQAEEKKNDNTYPKFVRSRTAETKRGVIPLNENATRPETGLNRNRPGSGDFGYKREKGIRKKTGTSSAQGKKKGLEGEGGGRPRRKPAFPGKADP